MIRAACVLAVVLLAMEQVQAQTRWVDAFQLGVYGQGFKQSDLDSPYDRLTKRAQGVVRDAVWQLSRDSAGLFISFVSNSTTISVDYALRSKSLNMWHMSTSGVSGCDLWAFESSSSAWRWVQTFSNISYPESTGVIASDASLGGAPRRYMLFLPTYNGVLSFRIGVNSNAILQPDPQSITKLKPIIYYGTSIAQGAVSSRPGNAYTNQIARVLGRQVFNYGFSGNGWMDTELMQFLLEIDAAAIVIDCLPNMNVSMVAAKTQPLVKQIRAARPDVPVVLVEDAAYGFSWDFDDFNRFTTAKNAALAAAYQSLVQAGVQGLHYVHTADLFGPYTDINPTVDGTHPTDLGHYQIGSFFSTFLPPILKD